MTIKDIKELNIPKSPGCYFFLGENGEIIYIGKAADLRSRVLSYFRPSANHTPAKSELVARAASLNWETVDTEIEALLLEANLVKKHQPYYNVLLRDDKRFLYIKVSTEDEVPGVFATRKIDQAGRYFGPFTSSTAVRETLKALRKIWPYCTTRKLAPKPCFYYQVGRCAGACGGVISREEYLEQVIKPIIMFLEGKKRSLVSNYESRMSQAEKSLSKLAKTEAKSGLNEKVRQDKAGLQEIVLRLKYELENFNSVLAHAAIIGIGEKYAADVVELAKVLGLPRIPARIEGYDIANIFGREAVGSLVTFQDGEPDKSGYRKFKIRIGEGEANDVRMLKEVLTRRFERAKGTEGETEGERGDAWALPDLMVIDGGKGQLNAALSVMKKYRVDIPVLAISKGEGLRTAQAPDKIFFPGQAKPLMLPLASPALHVIKRVRDEAHRFAIGYHRQLRKRRMFR